MAGPQGLTALLVVDVQRDFLPGGALPVAEGDRILGPVGDVIRTGPYDVYVATQDWHPSGHVSFASSHPGRRPFETIQLYGHPQTLWPDHCVQGTAGSALVAGLPWDRMAAIIRKGTDPGVDSYSGIRNNWDPTGQRPPTGLAGFLRSRGVSDVHVCGLARDYCVKWTAEDAAREGFRTAVLWDLTRPVDPGSDGRVRSDLEGAGVRILTGTPPTRPPG